MTLMTEQDLKKALGKNVSRRRGDTGLSQEELAEKVGVSKNTISDIEGGNKFARAKTLINLAKAFDTEVYELLKPDTVLPDKPADILAKYSGEVRECVERIGNSYIEDMKR